MMASFISGLIMDNKRNEMRRTRTQCRFFLQGNCRFGDRCWYSHEQGEPNSAPVVAGDGDVQPHVPSTIHPSHDHIDPNNNIIEGNKSASSMAPIECGICLEEYNKNRRPKTLPCAHNFCGACLESCIALGETKCSVCRSTYTAATVDDIPINTDFEKLIEMFKGLQKVTRNKKINKECSELQDFSKHQLKEASDRRIAEKLQEDEELEFALALSKSESKKIEKEVSSLWSITRAQHFVYLELQADGKPLGRIVIHLTCGPKRREYMLRLCTGQGGTTWKGSWFDIAYFVGFPGERIMCNGYLTPNGGRCLYAITKDLENNECMKCDKGAVTALSFNDAGFMICTRSSRTNGTKGPEIGYVVSGLNLLSQAMHQYTTCDIQCHFNASRIRMVDAGVHIAYK